METRLTLVTPNMAREWLDPAAKLESSRAKIDWKRVA